MGVYNKFFIMLTIRAHNSFHFMSPFIYFSQILEGYLLFQGITSNTRNALDISNPLVELYRSQLFNSNSL